MPPGEVLIPRERIAERVGVLAGEVGADLPEGPLHIVTVLKGALFFAADLIRALGREATLGFVLAASYGAGTESSGDVSLSMEALGEVEGRSVLLIDDILDTGRTLAAVHRVLAGASPPVLRTCVLLDKPSRREVPFEADHVGFTIEDRFVVGYGLDFAGRHRTFPDIRVYLPEGPGEPGEEGSA